MTGWPKSQCHFVPIQAKRKRHLESLHGPSVPSAAEVAAQEQMWKDKIKETVWMVLCGCCLATW